MGEARRARLAAEKAAAIARAKMPPPPPRKKVAVTVAFHLEYEVPEDWGDSDVAFYIEENHCIGNFVNMLHAEVHAEPGICSLCSHGAAFVGHIPLGKIGGLRS